jgi:iron complex outermembrane receptor protein
MLVLLRSTTRLTPLGGILILSTLHAALAQSADRPPQSGVEGAPYDEIVVVGRAMQVAPSAPPLNATEPTSVIQKEFIQNNIVPLASFDDIIKFMPSVWDQSPNGPGLGKSETLSLRGFQDGQFNITFDGIPFGDATDLHHTSSALFIAHDVGEAQIDRGPGTASTIGNATFGGTMAFSTKQPLDELTVNLYGTYGSYSTGGYGFEIDTGNGDLGRGFFDIQRENSNGYLTYATEDRTNFMFKHEIGIGDSISVTTQASYNHAFEYTTQGATLANIQAFGPNFGLNNNPNTQAYYGYQPSNYYSDFEYIKIKADLGDDWKLQNTVYTDSFEHSYIESKDASDTNPADNGLTYYNALGAKLTAQTNAAKADVPGKYTDAFFRAFGDVARVTRDFSFGELQAGMWIERNDDHRWSYQTDLTQGNIPVNTKYGTPYSYNFKDSLTTYQPYVEFDWEALPGLTVTPGVRYVDFVRDLDAVENKTKPPAPANFTESWGTALPSISARYNIQDNWTAYIQAAQGFLAPPISVLEVSTNPTSVAPEETWNYQAGTTAHLSDMVLGLDVYYIDFSNYITTLTVGGISTYYNGGGAIYQGAETELQYIFGNGFSLYGNGSYNKAQYKGTHVDLALTPQWTAAAGILYDDKQGPYFSVIAKWIGARYGNDLAADGVTHANSVGLEPYVSADFAGGWRFSHPTSWVKDFSISLKVSNIFDNRKINGYAGTQSATPANLYWTNPGRSEFLNLSVSF